MKSTAATVGEIRFMPQLMATTSPICAKNEPKTTPGRNKQPSKTERKLRAKALVKLAKMEPQQREQFLRLEKARRGLPIKTPKPSKT